MRRLVRSLVRRRKLRKLFGRRRWKLLELLVRRRDSRKLARVETSMIVSRRRFVHVRQRSQGREFKFAKKGKVQEWTSAGLGRSDWNDRPAVLRFLALAMGFLPFNAKCAPMADSRNAGVTDQQDASPAPRFGFEECSLIFHHRMSVNMLPCCMHIDDARMLLLLQEKVYGVIGLNLLNTVSISSPVYSSFRSG
jgi:hypothetical protein